MQFWDTSTLLKLYVPEPDAPEFQAHLREDGIAASEFCRWELLRAVVRKETEGSIAPNDAERVFQVFENQVSHGLIQLHPFDSPVQQRFQSLVLQLHRYSPPVLIRTLDAIHLATALEHGATEFVVTDNRLRDAAVAMNLPVYP